MKIANLFKFQTSTYSNNHEMNPILDFGPQNLPLHLLNVLFAKFFNSQFLEAFF